MNYLVDTTPKDARNQGSINLGAEIVADMKNAKIVKWWETVDLSDLVGVDWIGFNVYYPTHLLNIYPFFKNNFIRRSNGIQLAAGGQGLPETHILSELVDVEFYGELDFERNKDQILSNPVIDRFGGKAAIEISRGCQMNCKFCEYSHKHKHREKPIELVRSQIDWVDKQGIRDINFMSANFAGYKDLGELIDYAVSKNIRILNCDSCPIFLPRLFPYLKFLPKYIKIGIESFDENTRSRIGKPFADDFLEDILDRLLSEINGVHLYLIYGLLGDNYDSWFRWLEKIAEKRKAYSTIQKDLFGGEYRLNDKNIRIEFSITNFEPCLGTPFEKMPMVDFDKKAKFIEKWAEALIANGYRRGDKKIEYKNARGRFGRKELTYMLLMALKNGGPELTQELKYTFPNGVGRSIKEEDAAKFLLYKEDNEILI